MKNFKNAIPFDPGFSKISFSFIENMEILKQDYKKQKANHQKKFWLIKFEPKIIDLINKSTAFYLGCILWGSFIHFRFKDTPKEITGNTTEGMNEAQLEKLDCAIEVKAILQYINELNKDFKYFLNKSIKISDLIYEILDSYIEFAQINNNFININNTKDIKIPKSTLHFKSLTEEQLDSLCEKIYKTIDSVNMELLLDLGFYEIK